MDTERAVNDGDGRKLILDIMPEVEKASAFHNGDAPKMVNPNAAREGSSLIVSCINESNIFVNFKICDMSRLDWFVLWWKRKDSDSRFFEIVAETQVDTRSIIGNTLGI